MDVCLINVNCITLLLGNANNQVPIQLATKIVDMLEDEQIT